MKVSLHPLVRHLLGNVLEDVRYSHAILVQRDGRAASSDHYTFRFTLILGDDAESESHLLSGAESEFIDLLVRHRQLAQQIREGVETGHLFRQLEQLEKHLARQDDLVALVTDHYGFVQEFENPVQLVPLSHQVVAQRFDPDEGADLGIEFGG